MKIKQSFFKAYLVSCIDLHKLSNHVRLSFAIDKKDAELHMFTILLGIYYGIQFETVIYFKRRNDRRM